MAKQKTALITGITGQDGAYLAQFLLQKNYHIIGAARRASTLNLPRLAELGISASVDLRMLDIQDLTGIIRLLQETAPDEIYHLGGQSSVPASFQQPIYTAETATLGILRLLEAIKLTAPETRLFMPPARFSGAVRPVKKLTRPAPAVRVRPMARPS